MNQEDFNAKILELENELKDQKILNEGLVNKQKEYETTISDQKDRIFNLLEKNNELYLKVSQPVEEVEFVSPEPKGPTPESTISIDDLFR